MSVSAQFLLFKVERTIADSANQKRHTNVEKFIKKRIDLNEAKANYFISVAMDKLRNHTMSRKKQNI